MQTALLCQDDAVPPLSSLSSYLMNLLLPLPKSGVVWALAVLEKHMRRDFFIYKPSAWQTLRAGTFQARYHAATGTLPPSLGAGMEGWAGITTRSCPAGHDPSTATHHRSSPALQRFHRWESLRRRHRVYGSLSLDVSSAEFPSPEKYLPQ